MSGYRRSKKNKATKPGRQTSMLNISNSLTDSDDEIPSGVHQASEARNRRYTYGNENRDSLEGAGEEPVYQTVSRYLNKTWPSTLSNQASKIFYCEPCLNGHIANEASGYCINCSEYLCETCYGTHKNHKSFREHELKTLDEMPKDGQPVTVIEYKCMLHDEPRIYECYCKSCDQLACAECVNGHQSCQGVEFIRDVVKTFQDSNECEEFTENLETLKAGFAEFDDSFTTNMRNTRVYKENAKVKVSLQVEKIEEQLKATERNIKAEIQTKFEKEQTELNELKKKHEEWKKQFEIINTQIEHYRKSGRSNLLFIYVKKAREILDRLKENVEDMKGYTIQAKDFTEDFNTLFQPKEQDDYDLGSDEVLSQQ